MLSDLWNRLIAWTGTIVTPDWAALVALIPLLLLLVVIAFLVVTAAKWASAGPVQRGPGRRQPVGPDGTPLVGPAAAPFLVAVGAFVLAFGLVAGGPALPAGIALTAVGLAWWAWGLRQGAGQKPTATRPIEGADALAARTATKSGPRAARVTPARVAIAGAAILLVAVVAATTRVVPDAPGTASATGGSIAPVPSDASRPTLAAADVTLAAQDVAFVQTTLTAPAGRPFTVAFDNRDKVPHNLEIRDAAGNVLFLGDVVTGPTIVVYTVPSLPAGQYPFVCTVHPAMTGTLTVK